MQDCKSTCTTRVIWTATNVLLRYRRKRFMHKGSLLYLLVFHIINVTFKVEVIICAE